MYLLNQADEMIRHPGKKLDRIYFSDMNLHLLDLRSQNIIRSFKISQNMGS